MGFLFYFIPDSFPCCCFFFILFIQIVWIRRMKSVKFIYEFFYFLH